MSTSEQKAFCVLQFAKTESAIAVKRAFRVKFGCQPPNDNNFRRWYHQFETTSCICKGQTNLEVVSDDVQELLDTHNQELTMDELIEMHEQEQDIEELESLDPVQSEE
ncbi:DUF4817 domain-containing protein [Trichonephila clavipes]|nr:DUF4817 domain-containing protein [Trichonephila clavipes]